MHPRFRIHLTTLSLLALFLAPLAACSPAKEADTPQKAAGSAAPAVETPATDIDLEAVAEKARGETEKIRLTMAASRETKIEVLRAEPGDLPGLVNLKLRVTRQGRSAIRTIPVTADLEKAVVGAIVPLGRIPRMRVEMDNVNLENVPVRGNPDAEVTIVEYSDFQCPYCRATQPNIERLLREYDGRVKLVFKHYPLKSHEWAMDAAMLSECARTQKPELFWKLHDYYYGESTKISRENIFQLTQDQVRDEGVDMDAFNKCYLEQKPLEAIRATIDEGTSVGVRGTPAYLINDVFASGAMAYDILNALVLEELGEDPMPGAGESPEAAPTSDAG